MASHFNSLSPFMFLLLLTQLNSSSSSSSSSSSPAAAGVAAVYAPKPEPYQSQKTDAEALLLFKSSIQKDSRRVLASWKLNHSSCHWYGVTCADQGRATSLNLSGCLLSGTLDFRSLSSLQMLSSLSLSSNKFYINSTIALLHLPQSLTYLDLSSSGLTGVLPDEFLSDHHPNLIYLNLSNNNLTGKLPEFGNLQVLDLSFNNLSGSISPLMFGESCKNLLHFDLSANSIVDVIPSTMSNCTNLKVLNLSSNSLVGQIPGVFAKLGGLQRLDLSRNRLAGSIPEELGNACGSLLQLQLSHNNFSGQIPASFMSCNSLKLLDLSNNNLSGPLPIGFLQNLISLEMLQLSNNFISGSFPSSIAACKSLRVIDFSSNKFTGSIPPGICSGDSLLEELRVPDNLMSGALPASLSNCTRFRVVDFSINYLQGSIPTEFGELKYLEHLMLWFNGLEGRIPAELGRCSRLRNLILNNNFIGGDIPVELFNCSNLEWISLTSNMITGILPPELGKLSRLAVLQLANNSLTGNLPEELVNCSSLVWLDLNSNNFTGKIPPRLGRQPDDEAFSGILSGNTLAFVRNVGNSCKGVGGLLEFAGIRPERLIQVPTLKTCDFTRLYSGAALSGWTHYQTLEYLDLSYNDLQGRIPPEFGDMVVLQVLDVSQNNLSGEIPATLGRLRNLGVFDASHNILEGNIPDSFSNLSFLVQIDVSYNNLSGPIPARGQLSTLPAGQYRNNPGLCGVPLPPCQAADSLPAPFSANSGKAGTNRRSSTNGVIIGVLISITSLCILTVLAIVMRARKREKKGEKMLHSLHAGTAATTWKIEKEKEPLSINVATFQRQLRKLKFSQLVEATNGFSAASLVGCGGFGEVFKATLKDGTTVAIKKLIHLSYQGDREFVAEMETLGKIKHKNLVPLLGYCKVGEERLLVYEYMQYGSLEDVLHGKPRPPMPGGATVLSWAERKKIARGAARGLCFLHHNCIPHIIHRDMKSSNVLLDDQMEPRVSDFGMARLISALDTHLSVSSLAGTPGYVPPEYYQSFRCTAKGDVYSFGVVLLELLTGRRPTDKEDFGETNLVGWAKIKVREGKGREVVDGELLLEAAKATAAAADGGGGAAAAGEEEMMRFLEVALRCVEDFPSKRANMVQVVAMLRELKLADDVVDGDVSFVISS